MLPVVWSAITGDIPFTLLIIAAVTESVWSAFRDYRSTRNDYALAVSLMGILGLYGVLFGVFVIAMMGIPAWRQILTDAQGMLSPVAVTVLETGALSFGYLMAKKAVEREIPAAARKSSSRGMAVFIRFMGLMGGIVSYMVLVLFLLIVLRSMGIGPA